jgi:hypothetical protein
MQIHFAPYLWGLVPLLVLIFILKGSSGTFNPLKLIMGVDGRPSTSLLQFWLWTFVVLFSYTAIYAARVSLGEWTPIDQIPQNLLIAMGLSVVTATAAKGITVSYVSSGQVAKDGPAGGGVFTNDKGYPDLSKVQMIAWTFIAIAQYLINVAHKINANDLNELKVLPDIDAALMVLMGLGHGAYLGNKLVTTTTPRISGISPAQVGAGGEFTISGQSLGDSQGNFVTIDGAAIPFTGAASDWKETEIKCRLPLKHPKGNTDWTQGQTVVVKAIVQGQESNTISLTIKV